jgi:hypothetical protein
MVKKISERLLIDFQSGKMLLNSSFFSILSSALSSESSMGAELVPGSFLLNKNCFFGYMFLVGATASFCSSTGPNFRI